MTPIRSTPTTTASPAFAATPGIPATRFLDADAMRTLVQRVGLPACIAGVAARIEREFARWGDYDKSARVACHSRDGVIELMPVADERLFGFKYVNGHPKNTALGLPTVMAFGVLADVPTGMPTLLAELTLATAIRTAAMSALAARTLARPGARTMALIGNGAQSEFQALAFRDLLGVRTLRVYDTDARATDKLAANLAGNLAANLAANLAGGGLAIVRCTSAAEAARGADIVTTCTADKTRATILGADMLAPGQHINAVGGDCPGKTELHPDVLQRGSVFVEYAPQTRIEGELQQMPADFPATELWQVLAGHQPGRRHDDEITIFDSVGFALEDLAALAWFDEQAARLGLGRPVELVLQPEDPKDLFGSLRRGAARLAA